MIDNDIVDPDYYTILCQALLSAKEGDEFHILINTYGGNVSSGLAITDAMQRSKAIVVTNVLGYAYSCGAMIWAFGDRLQMGKFARIMFHSSSHMAWGKSADIADQASGLVKGMKYLMSRIVKRGVITQEESDKCFNSKLDVYFNYNHLAERLAGLQNIPRDEVYRR
jgi:ATP-dependent protease ClpP protease subunit